jgi:predicted transposase/invertase (TIGR01784 family)
MRTIADSYIEEGFNKGIMQGIKKGKAEGKGELIKMMLNQGNSIDTIAKITGLSFADIKALI